MRNSTLAVLSLVIVVSGCVGGGGNENSEDTPATAVLCSQMQIDVLEANRGDVKVINLGDSSFGNMTITWEYSGGNTVIKEVETPDVGERVTYESSRSGMPRKIDIQHNSCPSRGATQY